MSAQEPRQLCVGPWPGATAASSRWLWALDDCRRQTKEELRDITLPVLDWQPFPAGNSIGTLLYHLAAIELDWLYADVLEGHAGWPPDLAALFTRDVRNERGQLSAVRGVSVAAHLHRLDVVRQHLVATLQTMSLREFRRARRLPTYTVTPEWVVHHLLQHEAEHRGQIALLRGWAEQGHGAP